MAKGDVSTPSSSRSLAHPTGNPNNKPLTSEDHPERSKHDEVLHHFALKPMALGEPLPFRVLSRGFDGAPKAQAIAEVYDSVRVLRFV